MSPVQSSVKPTNDHSYPALDYPVGLGTGLVAVKDGVIRDMPGVATRQLFSGLRNGQAWPNAGGGSPNSGNVIVIDHGNNEYTAYLHCSPFNVDSLRGKAVRRGDVFAQSGNNGWSTGPHLHFEYWKDGVRIDPNVILNQGGTIVSNPNSGDVDNAYVLFNGRAATQSEKDVYTKKDWSAGDGLYYGKVFPDVKALQKALQDAQNASYEEIPGPVYKKK